MSIWRDDREEAWRLWIHDHLRTLILGFLVGHDGHGEDVQLLSPQELKTVVDVALVLGDTRWQAGDIGQHLTNLPDLAHRIAQGIITSHLLDSKESQ